MAGKAWLSGRLCVTCGRLILFELPAKLGRRQDCFRIRINLEGRLGWQGFGFAGRAERWEWQAAKAAVSRRDEVKEVKAVRSC